MYDLDAFVAMYAEVATFVGIGLSLAALLFCILLFVLAWAVRD